MDWQTPEDSFPTDFITDAQLRAIIGRPPISGAWRDGDPVGDRKFVQIGTVETEARKIMLKASECRVPGAVRVQTKTASAATKTSTIIPAAPTSSRCHRLRNPQLEVAST